MIAVLREQADAYLLDGERGAVRRSTWIRGRRREVAFQVIGQAHSSARRAMIDVFNSRRLSVPGDTRFTSNYGSSPASTDSAAEREWSKEGDP